MSEPGKDHKVKGSLLVALATIINAAKDLDWTKDGLLTEDDLKLIKRGILSSKWYDRGLWERMSLSVYRVVGKSKPESAYIFGKGILGESLLRVYQGPLVQKNVKQMLAEFSGFYGTAWCNFGTQEFKSEGNENILKITHPDGIPIQECFIPMVKGLVTRMIEANGGTNVRVECDEEKLAKSQNLTTLTLRLFWD